MEKLLSKPIQIGILIGFIVTTLLIIDQLSY